MRLVDVEPIIQFIEDGLNNPDKKKAFGYDAIEILSEIEYAPTVEIEYAPTVEAVPVVRCKDCKHWHEETGWCTIHSHFVDSYGMACHPSESSDWKMFDEDYFCKDGERKGTNENR